MFLTKGRIKEEAFEPGHGGVARGSPAPGPS